MSRGQTRARGKRRAHRPWGRRLALLPLLALASAGGPIAFAPSSTADLATPPDGGRGSVVIRADQPSIIAPSVGLAAPLDPVRFEGSVLEPPEDVRHAGLWADGADLSARGRGTTVITGHVSDGQDRPGEFKALWELRPGMTATTRDDEGQLRRWRVTKTQRFEKDELPRSLFLAGTSRTLRLITCASRVQKSGGAFHYEDNLVVDLEPVDASALPGDRVSALS